MKKKIHTDGHGSATGNSEQKPKRKAAAKYAEPVSIARYREERDVILNQLYGTVREV